MKNVDFLIAYATAQIGRPYWCGTFGQIASEWLYSYNKKRLPAYYTAADYPSQYGQKVHDCCGLIKGAKWCATVNSAPTYIANEDLTVKGLYDSSYPRGAIVNTEQLRNGTLLFRGNFSHVGIYNNGRVIHALGHAYGVIQQEYRKEDWAYYGELRSWFNYNENMPSAPSNNEIMVGDAVRMSKDATVYGTKTKFAGFVYDTILYVREIQKNRVVISIYPTGAITGAVNKKYLVKV